MRKGEDFRCPRKQSIICLLLNHVNEQFLSEPQMLYEDYNLSIWTTCNMYPSRRHSENHFLGTQRNARASWVLELTVHHLKYKEVKYSRGLRSCPQQGIAGTLTEVPPDWISYKRWSSCRDIRMLFQEKEEVDAGQA